MKIDPIYKKLMDGFGISAYESDIKAIMHEEMRKYSNYSIEYDNLGSIFAVKKSKNPNAKTVMVAGHMDEVGLMVSGIMPNGGLRVIPIGGLVPEVFISQVMYVKGTKGLVPGVIGSIPPHLSKAQKVEFSDFVLDIGASSLVEVNSFGVSIGDMVLNENTFIETIGKK